MNGSELRRSSSANHSRGSEISGSSKTPSGTTRIRTSWPSKRNSRGSLTAWLRPLRKSLAIPLLAIGRFASIIGIYHKSISNAIAFSAVTANQKWTEHAAPPRLLRLLIHGRGCAQLYLGRELLVIAVTVNLIRLHFHEHQPRAR